MNKKIDNILNISQITELTKMILEVDPDFNPESDAKLGKLYTRIFNTILMFLDVTVIKTKHYDDLLESIINIDQILSLVQDTEY